MIQVTSAGEDPSNSSFRRAMRKASGTVSIVDKDAFCYTKLVTDGCSPPFRPPFRGFNAFWEEI